MRKVVSDGAVGVIYVISTNHPHRLSSSTWT